MSRSGPSPSCWTAGATSSSSATAGGKTEAAFLPIVSRLAAQPSVVGEGFHEVYVSPMRALINDQFGRKAVEKFDAYLSDDLQTMSWARDRIEVEGLPGLASCLLAGLERLGRRSDEAV